MRFLDAGESHGRMLVAIVEGMPSNLEVDVSYINHELNMRQHGFGRGDRMKIEKDSVEIVSGISNGKTTGGPVTLIIQNRDYQNWEHLLNSKDRKKILRPRPGHADLSGAIKYNLDDIRDVIERSSARETAIRTAVGALASVFLREFGICAFSRVIQIGSVKDNNMADKADYAFAEKSEVMCSNAEVENLMIQEIVSASKRGDTLGGRFEVVIKNVPPGIGSYVHWDRRLDSRIAGAVMGIQGIKAVEIGNALSGIELSGSKFHDEIYYSQDKGYYRKTNNSGGIEGGMSNGEDIIIRAVMKPIPTLRVPLKSVDINTKNEEDAIFERSDVCSVPAAGIVARNVCMWEIADMVREKFGGDSMEETVSNFNSYIAYVKSR